MPARMAWAFLILLNGSCQVPRTLDKKLSHVLFVYRGICMAFVF